MLLNKSTAETSRRISRKITLTYAVFASLWILASGYFVASGVTDPGLLWRIEAAKGLGFVAVTSLLLYLLLSRWMPFPESDETLDHAGARLAVVALMVALVMLVPLAGYLIWHFYTPVETRRAMAELQAIAALQVEQVSVLRADRFRDMQALADDALFAGAVAELATGSNGSIESDIERRLDTIRRTYGYLAVALVDEQGQTLIGVGNDMAMSDRLRDLLQTTRSTGMSSDSDMYLDADDQLRIDFMAPLNTGQDAGNARLFVVFHADPANFLRPINVGRPAPYLGTETVMVGDYGEETRVITWNQALPEPQIHLLGADDSRVSAVAARAADSGAVEGRDVFGTQVIAAFQPLPDSRWKVLVKLDRQLMLVPVWQLAVWVSVFVFAACISVGILLLLLWHQQRHSHHLTLLAQSARYERNLEQQQAVYREMFDANPHPMWVYDLETLRFLAVNDAAVEHYGYSREQFLAMTLLDIRPKDDKAKLLQHLEGQPESGVDLAGTWRHKKADGSIIAVEISSHQLQFDGRAADMVLAYDVTGRLEDARRLKSSEQFAKSVIDALGFNIAVLNESGTIIATNKAWRDFALANGGDERDTGVGVNYLEVSRQAAADGSSEAEIFLEGIESVLHGTMTVFMREYPCHTASEDAWFVVQVTRFISEDGTRLVIAHENVTRRKLAELELQRLNRYYSALSDMSTLMIRSHDEDEILKEVCQIAVEQGELALVWVGKLSSDDNWVQPLVSCGEATGYLHGLRVSTSEDKPEGRGPVGIAVRTQQSCVFNHFASDNRSAPWHAAAESWNLRSASVCPIFRAGRLWGVIAFYAREEGYFSERLVSLLQELSADLTFSLDTIDRDRLRAEAQAQLLLNARVIESSHEGIFITDSGNRLVMVNRALCNMVGYSEEELLGETPQLFESGRRGKLFYRRVWKGLSGQGRWEGEVFARRKTGETFPVWVAVTHVPGDMPADDRFIAICRDISERKAYEKRIEHLASHDILTDLPNRLLLDDRISVAIAQARRNGQKVALVFVDLDRFKLINDTLGHEIGDKLLKAVSERIKSVLRASDTVGRVGGDEFVVLISNVRSSLDAASLAEKLIIALAQPFSVDGHELLITASAGIALYPEHGDSADALMRFADMAMMTAKQAGQNRFQVYSGQMSGDMSERLELQNLLRGALARNELFVVYQPQVRLRDGKLIGVEALLRWRNERLGLVPPDRFISIAEDSGLIVELGTWVMKEACLQCQQWREKGIVDVPVSVNVSALQLRQDDFIEVTGEVIKSTGLPPANLELEVTESMLMIDLDRTREKLVRLNDMGLHFAIDDFGTGYSSLSYLRQFPAQRLKIDKSFIQDLPESQDAAAIARAIVSLGNTLGMGTIAEGVETEEQADFLRSIWCEQAQGYLYARPMPADEFEAWLTSNAGRKTKAKTR